MGSGECERSMQFKWWYVMQAKEWLYVPRGLSITVVDVLGHGIIIKQVLKFPLEIWTQSIYQPWTWQNERKREKGNDGGIDKIDKIVKALNKWSECE